MSEVRYAADKPKECMLPASIRKERGAASMRSWFLMTRASRSISNWTLTAKRPQGIKRKVKRVNLWITENL